MSNHKTVTIGNLTVANDLPFTLFAGPCAIESEEHTYKMAKALKDITERLNIPFVFKSSFDKANRTSIDAPRGVGLDKALEIFTRIKNELGLNVMTDVHEPSQCAKAASVVDMIQLPAFLSRQTDLLISAGETGKAVNVKKGQFMAPWDMANVLKKMESTGNKNILLCDRGTSFGYNTLVTDFRGLEIMKQTGYPVVFDATHSVQSPSGQGGSTGGQREFAPYLARCAVSVGVSAIFMETHDDPDNAFSDGPNMIPLKYMEEVLSQLKAFDDLAKKIPYNAEHFATY